jgi:hypothetical protein
MSMVVDSTSPLGYKVYVCPNTPTSNNITVYQIQALFDTTGSVITDLYFSKVTTISISVQVSSISGGTDIVAIGTTDTLTLSGNITIYQVSTKSLLATYYGNSTYDKYFGQLLYLDQRSSYSYISMIRILQNPSTNAFTSTLS